jgi:hypothetical protein
MHLYEFATELEKSVVDFQAYWRGGHNDPQTATQFPYEMEPGDWFEQFTTWLQMSAEQEASH